jgi:hypothetical protein
MMLEAPPPLVMAGRNGGGGRGQTHRVETALCLIEFVEDVDSDSIHDNTG